LWALENAENKLQMKS